MYKNNNDLWNEMWRNLSRNKTRYNKSSFRPDFEFTYKRPQPKEGTITILSTPKKEHVNNRKFRRFKLDESKLILTCTVSPINMVAKFMIGYIDEGKEIVPLKLTTKAKNQIQYGKVNRRFLYDCIVESQYIEFEEINN